MRTANNYNYDEMKKMMKDLERQMEQERRNRPDFYKLLDYIDGCREEAETTIINNIAMNAKDGDTIDLRDIYWLNSKGFYLLNGLIEETGRKYLKPGNDGKDRQRRTYRITLMEQYTKETKEVKFSIILTGKMIEEDDITHHIKKYLDTVRK